MNTAEKLTVTAALKKEIVSENSTVMNNTFLLIYQTKTRIRLTSTISTVYIVPRLMSVVY